MKKFLCSILSIAIILSVWAMPTFAVQPESVTTGSKFVDDGVQPRGVLFGSRTISIDAGVTTGSFTVYVSGTMNWPTAQINISIAGFNSDDFVDAKVFRPDGTECFHIAGWLGDALSPSANTSTNWQTYSNGTRGTYTVVYSVTNLYNNPTGSGALTCAIK